MNKKVLIFFIITALLLQASCSFFSFTEFYVSLTPNKNTEYSEIKYITVQFSEEPNHLEAENIFMLKENSNAIGLDCTWSGNSCVIQPHTGWRKGYCYEFLIDGKICLYDGRTYSVHEKNHFIYGKQDNLLELENVTVSDSIILKFNKQIEQNSFLSDFTLSPYVSTTINFSSDKMTAIIKPKEKWPVNTLFTWTIDNVHSLDEYPLFKSYSGTFTSSVDIEQPEILLVCPAQENSDHSYTPISSRSLDTLCDAEPICILFSKEMDADSVEKAIQFTPSIDGYTVSDSNDGKKFIFKPSESYSIGQVYELRVEKTAADLSGLPLNTDGCFYFTSANSFLSITSITTLSGTELLGTKDFIQISSSSPDAISFSIQFSTKINGASKYQTQNAIGISSLFPVTAIQPSLSSARWNAENTILTVEYENFSRSTNGGDTYYYELTCSGGKNGACNEQNQYLKEDCAVCFIVN